MIPIDHSNTMILPDAPITSLALNLTMEARLLWAARNHELATEHHRVAASLHSGRESQKAQTHVQATHTNALTALVESLAIRA